MEQRTCNIIMCCKGNSNLHNDIHTTVEQDIGYYMAKECNCSPNIYYGSKLEDILKEALYDYLKTADRPDLDVRNLLKQYLTYTPSLSERIILMFSEVHVSVFDSDKKFINGFTEELINQSRIDLGEKHGSY